MLRAPRLAWQKAGENVRGRATLLELGMYVKQQRLNQRLSLLATRLPDGFAGQVTFRR